LGLGAWGAWGSWEKIRFIIQFAVEQGDKYRPCDDATANFINSTYVSAERAVHMRTQLGGAGDGDPAPCYWQNDTRRVSPSQGKRDGVFKS
jgi:hypothetical protein